PLSALADTRPAPTMRDTACALNFSPYCLLTVFFQTAPELSYLTSTESEEATTTLRQGASAVTGIRMKESLGPTRRSACVVRADTASLPPSRNARRRRRTVPSPSPACSSASPVADGASSAATSPQPSCTRTSDPPS